MRIKGLVNWKDFVDDVAVLQYDVFKLMNTRLTYMELLRQSKVFNKGKDDVSYLQILVRANGVPDEMPQTHQL